jgi:hypothetical protein
MNAVFFWIKIKNGDKKSNFDDKIIIDCSFGIFNSSFLIFNFKKRDPSV